MPLVKILVIRFSAMGDVALIVPVIRSLVAAHPNVEVTVVTRPRFAPFFYDIERVKVFPADVDNTYNGIFGMGDLFRTLIRKASYDVVIDLHDHIRSGLLRTFFKLFFADIVVFDKGRKEKKAFSRKKNKITSRLPHTIERYQAAFEKAGFSFDLLPPPYFDLNETLQTVAREWLESKGLKKEQKWIGLAPFAMHASKIWPLENYSTLIATILEKTPAKFFLFGGGDKEIKYFENLRNKYPEACVVTAGELKIRHEIALMKHLDVMVCVDSANMHLAALAGVPVCSIWGGTHPDVGFAPYAKEAAILQITRDELPCRPCSVYGRETCYVGGFPCLTRISAEVIAEQVYRKLNLGGIKT
ncbi:MAG: glycosyltransferase family 9 protein [Cyclobacteriaceae bacterium]